MKTFLTICGIFWAGFAIVVVTLTWFNSSQPQAPADKPSVSTAGDARQSPEYRLACYQAGSAVELTDPLIGQFRTELLQMQQNFRGPLTTEQCAAQLYGTWKTLAAEGVHEPLLDLSRHLNDSVPPAQRGVLGLTDIGAAYATLRDPHAS